MGWCEFCEGYILSEKCNCKKYLIRDPDYEGDENQEIWEKSEISACKKYARDRFHNDSCDPEDFEIEIILNDSKHITVTARAEVEFDLHQEGEL